MISDQDVLLLAIHGDHAGLVELRSRLIHAGMRGEIDGPNSRALAEHWARLACRHGDPDDLITLALLLLARSKDARLAGEDAASNDFMAEAIAQLNVLADEGNDDALIELLKYAEQASPLILAMAAVWPFYLVS